MKQPTASMYPELPTEDGQNYRLQKISEIEQTLIKGGQARKSLYKKYKRAITSTDGIDTVLVSDCVFMSGLGIMIPIVLLPLEVAAGICGTVGICVKFARRKLHTKTQKNDQIRTIADSKLISMKYLISKALQDGQILDAEFKAIQRFNTMKEAICVKRSEISEDEKKETNRTRDGKSNDCSSKGRKKCVIYCWSSIFEYEPPPEYQETQN